MSKKLRTEAVDHLFDAILSLENREECYTFFEDVCTVNELLSYERYICRDRITRPAIFTTAFKTVPDHIGRMYRDQTYPRSLRKIKTLITENHTQEKQSTKEL